jgi:hypothetical protein
LYIQKYTINYLFTHSIQNRLFDYIIGIKNDFGREGNEVYRILSLCNRNVYQYLIAPEESKLSPQPLSYQIYMGTAKPPAPQQAPQKISSPFKTVMVDANGRPKPIKLR